MMIHAVTPDLRHLYQEQIEAMHRLRWRIYVEERGWRALRDMQAEPGSERDQYDDARAHYLLAIVDTGAVLGAMRLRPADDCSLLADHFAHLVEAPAPLSFGPDVWELTRLLRAPMNRSKDGAVRYAMNCALIEFSVSRKIERLVATAETFLVPMTRKAWGAKMRPIGLPQPYAEGEVIAVELYPDEEALDAMRRQGSISEQCLYEQPNAWQALHADPITAARLTRIVRSSAPA
jgi:acyl-homoserine lactone synthase